MKTFLLSILCLLSSIVFAQNKQSENEQLDLLRSPKSPAATIIGISPNEIHTSSDPNDLMVHLKNSTDNFTKIPKSFAIDVTPARIFGKKDKITKFQEGKNCFRDLVLSIAYRDSNDINLIKNLPRSPQMGFGFTIPLVKSKTNKFSEEKINNLVLLRQDYDKATEQISAFNKTSTLSDSDNQRFIGMNQYMTELKTQIKNQSYTIIRTFSLNLSGGLVRDYAGKTVTSKKGLWLTTGYDFTGEKTQKAKNTEKQKVFSVLVLLRYLNNIEPEYINAEEQKYSNFYDAGLKVNFTNNTAQHLNLAIESIYRKVKNPTLMTGKPSAFKDGAYRFAFNAEYQASKNFLFTLALGRDFDGTYTKNGNVFALINILGAIGSDRIQ